MGKIVSVKSYLPNTVIRRTGSGMTQPGLLKMENKIEIDEDLRLNAYNSLKNMHKLGG